MPSQEEIESKIKALQKQTRKPKQATEALRQILAIGYCRYCPYFGSVTIPCEKGHIPAELAPRDSLPHYIRCPDKR